MPFSARELLTSVRHRFIGLSRVITSDSPDRFILELDMRGVALSRVGQKARHVCVCPFCGYAMARVEMKPGWVVETCSAFLLRDMFENDSFPRYLNRLPSPENQAPAKIALAIGQAEGEHGV